MIARWFARMVRQAFDVEYARARADGWARGRENGYAEGLDRGFDKAVVHQIRHLDTVEQGAREVVAAQIRGEA
jgi:flagellar biosynthesis/type III secretory pathway protein FliH